MYIEYFYFFIIINLIYCDRGDFYSRDYRYSNTLACPDNKICIPLDYCSDIVTLLNEATIPIHRYVCHKKYLSIFVHLIY